MEELLYKAKGLNNLYIGIMVICNLALIILGVALLFFSQVRYTYYSMLNSGSLEQAANTKGMVGEYVFENGTRNIIMISGVVLIVLALILLESSLISNKSYILVFDSHIESMQYDVFLVYTKKFNYLTYDKINDVQLIKSENAINTDIIVLYTDYSKLMIVAKNLEKAYEIIKIKIK